MDKPLKDWGMGIPKYSKDDILEGLGLHEFCTNTVAEMMQNDGFIIDGVVINSAPTQVIANKDGKRYFVIVAGDIYPNNGRISYGLKKKFSEFCLKQGGIPMFASVGLMSADPLRAEAGLALKYDGYYVNYTGNEDLTNFKFPTIGDEDYKAYCVEKIIEAYCSGDFSTLYDLFDDNIQFHSEWVLEPKLGKKSLIEYYDKKGEALRKSPSTLNGAAVIITSDHKKMGNMILMSKPGRICALMSQKLNGKTNWIFISPEFNAENKITKICLNSPELFNFKPYYAFE